MSSIFIVIMFIFLLLPNHALVTIQLVLSSLKTDHHLNDCFCEQALEIQHHTHNTMPTGEAFVIVESD